MPECWEENECFWLVPVGIFIGLTLLGCCCGLCLGFGCSGWLDDDEEKTKKKSVDQIRCVCKL